MIRYLEIALRLINAAALFSQPLMLHFFRGRWQARGGTFFSVRVDPSFPLSDAGRAIMRTFRKRVWTWTTLAAMAIVFCPGDMLRLSRWMFLAFIVVWQGNWFAFHLANRSVRKQAKPVEPSPLRVAALAAEDRGTPVLALIEWSGMVLPLALPVSTAIVLILTGRPSGPLGPLAPFMLVFYFFVGFLPAQAQYALKYGARSSDWASDPVLSRQYRAYVGLVNTLVFGNIILFGCGMLLFPHHSWFVVLAFPPVYFALSRVRGWLKRHLAESSCDPMPDTCWKWGQYYFNPDDPALVVPSRTDISWSPNFARRSIWIGWAVVTVAIVFGLSVIFRMTAPHSM
jgi:hypothetical protein